LFARVAAWNTSDVEELRRVVRRVATQIQSVLLSLDDESAVSETSINAVPSLRVSGAPPSSSKATVTTSIENLSLTESAPPCSKDTGSDDESGSRSDSDDEIAAAGISTSEMNRAIDRASFKTKFTLREVVQADAKDDKKEEDANASNDDKNTDDEGGGSDSEDENDAVMADLFQSHYANSEDASFVIGKKFPFLFILPDGLAGTIWGVIILFLVLIQSVTIPLDSAFDISILGWGEWLVLVVFVVDICVSFLTPTEDEDGRLILEHSYTARAYMSSGWFAPDVVSCIPFDQFASSAGWGNVAAVKTLKLFRLMRVSKLIKRLTKAKNAGAGVQVCVLSTSSLSASVSQFVPDHSLASCVNTEYRSVSCCLPFFSCFT
jgi:hypothetical protein